MDFLEDICLTEEIHGLWLARKTIYEMIDDRKYVTNEPRKTEEEFRKLYMISNTVFSTSIPAVQRHATSPKQPNLIVCFPSEEKLRIQSIRDIIEYGETHASKFYHIIIVYRKSITPSAKSQLAQIKSEKKHMRIETFGVDELQYNPSKHVWVPPHRILSKAEKKTVLESLKCSQEHLPRILICDPIVRYYGGRANQVMEILKPTPDGNWCKHWRLISNRIMQ